MDERTLRAVLKFALDQESLNKVEKGTLKVEDALKKVEQQAAKTRERMEKLSNVGITMSMAGAAITAPFLMAAQAYATKMGQTEAVSRRWIASTKEMEKAQITFGRAAATALQPYMDALAKISNTIANFAQANPGAASAIVGVGVGLTALGALTTAVAKGVRLYADLQYLAAVSLQSAAAGTMLTAAKIQAAAAAEYGVTGGLIGPATAAPVAAAASGMSAAAIAASVVGIITLAVTTTGVVALIMNKAKEVSSTAGKIGIGVGAASVGSMLIPGVGPWLAITNAIGSWLENKFGGKSNASETQQTVDPAVLTNVLQSAQQYRQQEAQAAQQYQQQETQITQQYESQRAQIIKSYEQDMASMAEQYSSQRANIIKSYEQDIVSMTRQYESQRAQIIANFSQQQARSQEDYNRSRQQSLRDYRSSESQAEQEYYKQRKQAAEQYGLEVSRMEEDHQKEMRRLAEDHDQRMLDLADSRDALGIYREMHDYEKQRSSAEEDYQVQAARRSEDFARQMSEMEQNFASQRAQRQADFQQRMADQAAEYDIQRQRAQEDYQAQLKELDDNYKQQRQERAQQYLQQLQEATAQYQKERQARSDQYAQQIQEAKAEYAKQLQEAKTQYGLERTQRQNQFKQNLIDLSQNLTDEQKIKRQFTDAEIKYWEEQIKKLQQPTPTNGGRASGGYAGMGVYRLGELGEEFVLNASTTKSFEQLSGGRLTQERMLAMLAHSARAGGRGSRTVIYNDRRQFNSSLSEEIRSEIRRELNGGLGRILA